MPYDNPPASADLIVLIEGLETNIEDKSNHFTCPKSNIKVLEKPSNAFEVLMEGTPCRLFVDVDGEMSADTDEATFKKIVAECEQKFCADDRIIGVRNSSHFKALKIDKKRENGRVVRIKKIVKKISFNLIYNKWFETCEMIKDYAVKEILPQLQVILGDTIGIEETSETKEEKENILTLDTQVYRTNGKMRAINAYKYEEQPERINKIVKGSLLDNVIQHIPEGCEKIEGTIPEKSKPKPKMKIKLVAKGGEAVAEAKEEEAEAEEPASPVSEEENQLALKLFQGLKKERFLNYPAWFKMAIVVRQERWDYEMFEKVCGEKSKGSKYDTKETRDNNKAIFAGIKFRREGGLTQATLWNWLKEDNKAQFEALQKERKDFYRQLESGFAEVDYAKLFYSLRPERYFYSSISKWWEIRDNHRYYNTFEEIPIGITNVISEVLREVVNDQRKNLNPADEKTKERSAILIAEYKRLGGKTILNNIASFLPKLCLVEPEDFDTKMDANTNLIAFKDCVYDLQTNQYRQILPSDFISKTTRYCMGDKKSNPKQRKEVERILESIFPDKKVREYWVKCASLSFFTNRFEMLYILTGTGGNGKGLLTSYLKACGGDYVFTAETTFLTTVYKGGVANSCLASCDGVRIVLVSEPDNGEKTSYMNVEFVKSITGRDEICARALWKNVKTFQPTFTILLSCNTKPEIRKLDGGLLRRLSIHPFVCKFKSNPDPKKGETQGDSKLKGLVSDPAFIKEFMLYMIENAYANKDVENIEMPEDSKEAVNEYVEDNNQFKIWFETHYKSVAEIKEILERQLEQPVIEGETPKWIDVSREPTKEELSTWKKEHTHSTGEILKKYNSFTGGKMTPQMLLQAITYNEYHITKTGGQKFLKYYEYLEEIESENEGN